MAKFFLLVIVSVMFVYSCGKREPQPNAANNTSNPIQQVPVKKDEIKKTEKIKPEKLAEFKQEITEVVSLKKMSVGEETVLPLTIKNTSSVTWGKGVHPFYRWIDSQQKNVGTGNAYFANPVAGGESVLVQMKIKAPDIPGKYTLFISMVQEDVAFFDKQGAIPLEIPVTIQ